MTGAQSSFWKGSIWYYAVTGSTEYLDASVLSSLRRRPSSYPPSAYVNAIGATAKLLKCDSGENAPFPVFVEMYQTCKNMRKLGPEVFDGTRNRSNEVQRLRKEAISAIGTLFNWFSEDSIYPDIDKFLGSSLRESFGLSERDDSQLVPDEVDQQGGAFVETLLALQFRAAELSERPDGVLVGPIFLPSGWNKGGGLKPSTILAVWLANKIKDTQLKIQSHITAMPQKRLYGLYPVVCDWLDAALPEQAPHVPEEIRDRVADFEKTHPDFELWSFNPIFPERTEIPG